MLLALEYMLRTGFKNVPLPCSLFINTKNYNTKIAITIKNSNNVSKACVRHWFLSSCDKESALPTLKDYFVNKNELYSSPLVQIDNFKLLPYKCSGIPLSLNVGNGGHPMSFETYKYYNTSIFNTKEHQIAKECWLWHAFLRAYFGPSLEFIFENRGFSYFVYGEKAFGELLSEKQLIKQQDKVKTYFKQLWKNWDLWKRYMLPKEKISGELIFSSVYDNI